MLLWLQSQLICSIMLGLMNCLCVNIYFWPTLSTFDVISSTKLVVIIKALYISCRSLNSNAVWEVCPETAPGDIFTHKGCLQSHYLIRLHASSQLSDAVMHESFLMSWWSGALNKEDIRDWSWEPLYVCCFHCYFPLMKSWLQDCHIQVLCVSERIKCSIPLFDKHINILGSLLTTLEFRSNACWFPCL